MKDETRQALELFVEKAHKLIALSFTKHLLEHGLSLEVKWTNGSAIKIESTIPDDEAIDAFVLTIRFFVQKNELSSFKALETVLGDMELSEEWRQQFTRVHGEWNRYLDQQPRGMTLSVNGTSPTNREIMDVFLYGGLAHANKDKKPIFDMWQADPLVFSFRQTEFVIVLSKLLKAIQYLARLSEQELGMP